MLQEMKFEDAIKKYLKGRKVLALTDLSIDKDHQDYELEPLEDVLARMRYLVDVPAVENPDFAEAVQKMAQSAPAAKESTQGITQESPEEEENPEEHTEEPLEEHSCKKKLDAPSQELLTLVEQGMSQSAIAKILGITQSTVSYRLKQLRKENAEPVDSDK